MKISFLCRHVFQLKYFVCIQVFQYEIIFKYKNEMIKIENMFNVKDKK